MKVQFSTHKENSLTYSRENNRIPCEKIKFYFNTAKPVSVPVRFCKRNLRKDDCTIKLRIWKALVGSADAEKYPLPKIWCRFRHYQCEKSHWSYVAINRSRLVMYNGLNSFPKKHSLLLSSLLIGNTGYL